MSSFEFTPAGIVARQEEAPMSETIPAGVAIANLQAQVAQQESARSQSKGKPVTKADPSPLNRRHFVKELRSRLKVVEREIKRMRGLEDEAAEIKRLIAAAKQPPAKVVTIARKSG